ncbi:MAG: nucleoside hydrolase [Prolixibacteraceae bacterium]|nr:nucleoside hydrolase [Prolixibacteraceae bacterium]
MKTKNYIPHWSLQGPLGGFLSGAGKAVISGVKKSIPQLLQLKVISAIFMALLFSFGVEASREKTLSDSPPKVIIDTDIDSDVDDVGALAMLYNLHNAGEIELIGVIVTSDDPYAPVCADALNTFYGLPEIPVGFLKDQPSLTNHSRYTKIIAEEFSSGTESWKDAEDAVRLYRKLLARHPDESVVIVTVGHLSSLQGLLQSGPDRISELDGKDLVNEKVQEWICMGGHFPEGKEANFYRPDPGSTVYCVNNWEKDVVFCGWEVGNPLITGGTRLKGNLEPGHPVYRAYELYNGFAGRQSWDQIAVLQLVDESRQYFSYVTGTCKVNPDGSNSWVGDQSGKHRYLVMNPSVEPDYISTYIDRLMMGE